MSRKRIVDCVTVCLSATDGAARTAEQETIFRSTTSGPEAGWEMTPKRISSRRLGRAIRRVREAQKINQEETAERCGLHRTHYSGVERGIRNVSLVNIEKIAKGLRTSLPDLFGRV